MSKPEIDATELPYEITQISVAVRDLEKTLKTYHKALGWGRGGSSNTSRRCTTRARFVANPSSTGSSVPKCTSGRAG